MKRKFPLILLILAMVAAAVYYFVASRGREIVLTGIVTTDEVIVSSEIQGRLQKMVVRAGDQVTNGQLLALIRSEQKAELAYYSDSAEQSSALVAQAEADLAFQESQTSNLTWQSEANLAATKDQITQAQADLENVTLEFKREEKLYKEGVDSVREFDQARTAYDGAKARVDSLRKQAVSGEASVAMAKATGVQIAAREAALKADMHQSAAAAAQKDKAAVVLGYTSIVAPTNGIVDVRAALEGEVVSIGQGIVTLINPQDLWVRADVEETYIDRIHLGDKFTVRLPSGATREGTVFYRGVDADYATQRDVSRSKRDIKTFEIRLRCDNSDNALAVGMTAFVLLNLR